MKKRRRTPGHLVNRKQKALAIKALTAIVSSPDAAEYVKAKAAAALLNSGRSEVDIPLLEPDAPKRFVILPAKGDPGERYGQYDVDQRVIIVPSGFPFEVRPESFYTHVPKPGPDPRIAMRNRAKMLALPGSTPDDAA